MYWLSSAVTARRECCLRSASHVTRHVVVAQSAAVRCVGHWAVDSGDCVCGGRAALWTHSLSDLVSRLRRCVTALHTTLQLLSV